MQLQEAKRQSLQLIRNDLERLRIRADVLNESSPGRDPGKFFIDNRVVRVIAPFDGFFVNINLNWFTGSTDMPRIQGEPFEFYLFAISDSENDQVAFYYICHYRRIREFVLDFAVPRGRNHGDHHDWRGQIHILSVDDLTGYFRWGDEDESFDKPDRRIQLNNVAQYLQSETSPELIQNVQSEDYHSLGVGDEISNIQLSTFFQCSSQGGMRRSTQTNTLVLISNPIGSVYQDRWDGDDLYFTGMGLVGDQELEGNQNKTLYESRANEVEIHLFEVLRERVYTYAGQVELFELPFQENQIDINGNIRKVWIFPLRPKLSEQSRSVLLQDLYNRDNKRALRFERKSVEELSVIVSSGSRAASRRNASTTQFERSPAVAEYTRRRAKGVC